MPIPPYGTAIHQALATGDLAKMKETAKSAEGFLTEHGDIRSALEVLKAEIAKLEHKS
jgi:hypothetical protein